MPSAVRQNASNRKPQPASSRKERSVTKGLKGGQTRTSVPTFRHVLLFSLAVPAYESIPRNTLTKDILLIQTALFTPLSIRRGGGGEAFYYITCSQRRMSLRLANTINIMSIVIPAYSAQIINFSDGLRRVIIS